MSEYANLKHNIEKPFYCLIIIVGRSSVPSKIFQLGHCMLLIQLIYFVTTLITVIYVTIGITIQIIDRFAIIRISFKCIVLKDTIYSQVRLGYQIRWQVQLWKIVVLHSYCWFVWKHIFYLFIFIFMKYKGKPPAGLACQPIKYVKQMKLGGKFKVNLTLRTLTWMNNLCSKGGGERVGYALKCQR